MTEHRATHFIKKDHFETYLIKEAYYVGAVPHSNFFPTGWSPVDHILL